MKNTTKKNNRIYYTVLISHLCLLLLHTKALVNGAPESKTDIPFTLASDIHKRKEMALLCVLNLTWGQLILRLILYGIVHLAIYLMESYYHKNRYASYSTTETPNFLFK